MWLPLINRPLPTYLKTCTFVHPPFSKRSYPFLATRKQMFCVVHYLSYEKCHLAEQRPASYSCIEHHLVAGDVHC